jgi:membrane-associated phospholipid phosphatase
MRYRLPTIIAGVCALALGLVFAGDRTPSAVDDWFRDMVAGWPDGVLRVLVLPTEPYVLLPVLALLAGWCLYRSRPWDALFVAVGPGVALAVNTWVLKPLFDRWKGDTLVYPSGHTVGLVATLVVVFVLVRGRAITAIVGAVPLIGAAIGMVGLGYHYVTDIVGGTLFAVFAVGGLWPHPRRGADSRWLALSRNR